MAKQIIILPFLFLVQQNVATISVTFYTPPKGCGTQPATLLSYVEMKLTWIRTPGFQRPLQMRHPEPLISPSFSLSLITVPSILGTAETQRLSLHIQCRYC